jgi:malate dehydrogenase (quinone)
MQSPTDRLAALREYIPNARLEDRDLKDAGNRVQIIKADPKKGGKLEFGTEVVVSADGTLATLLGASPGASTAVSIMLQLLEKSHGSSLHGVRGEKLVEMIPSYGKKLTDDVLLTHKVQAWTDEVLGLRG